MEQNVFEFKEQPEKIDPYKYPFNLEKCELTQSINPHITVTPISHNYIFEYIVKGEGTLICNDKVYHLEKGDLFILAKGSNYQYFPDIKKPWTKIKFAADGILVSNLFVSYSLTDVVAVKGFNGERLFKDMLDLSQSEINEERKMLAQSLKFHEILQRVYITQSRNLPNDTAAAIRKILDTNLYKSDFSMKDVSTLLGLSKAQIINIFREKYNKTPYKYFIDRRIQLSVTMLLNTDMSIKEISDTLHFSDQHYYANVFRKSIGTSPKQFRKEHMEVFKKSSK
ncbi:MAG: helix-turn-helix domain-containing protein [Clostridia bacterium]|nr:helix-turn-helix domain-containing protein [Clostridia bacterium]